MTPGPWEVVTLHDQRSQPAPTYRGLVCVLEHSERRVSVVAEHGRPALPEEVDANARLIAAAPELLAACQVALDEHDALSPSQRYRLEAAIRKATGE